MKAPIVQIGNSRGIRIPKPLLEQYKLRDYVELEMGSDHLVLRPATRPREGWEAAFGEMRKRGDDALVNEAALPATEWDRTEWEWS